MATVLASDSFNRANSTTSLGTTDSYNGGTSKTWTVSGTGAYGIINNQAYAPTAPSSGHNVAYIDVGVADYDVSFTIATLASGESPKMAVRVVDGENMILLQMQPGAGFVLYYYQGGSSTDLATQPTFSAVNGSVIRVVCQGTTITAYCDGQQMLQATNVTVFQTSTKVGIMSYKYPNSRFDNFSVSDLNNSNPVSSGVISIGGTSTVTGTGKANYKGTAQSTGLSNVLATPVLGNLVYSGSVSSNSLSTVTSSGTVIPSNPVISGGIGILAVGSLTATAKESDIIISDSFNRADNTTSLGSTDSYLGGTSKAWVISGPNKYGIISNQAYCSSPSTTHSVATVDSGLSDAKISVTITTLSGNPKIAFRVTDADNCMLFSATSSGSGFYELYYYSGGGDNIIVTSNVVPKSGDVMSVVFKGTSVTCYVNDIQIISATSTFNQTATKHGIQAYNYGAARFDNFTIETLSNIVAGQSTISAKSTVTATVLDVTPPVITPSVPGGTYGPTQVVSLSSNEQASIYYTLNGTSPAVNSALPLFDKVVVVIMENHTLGQIEGNSSAPYMNSLMQAGANFHHMQALTHPSEPNYFMLFSGSNQGITDDAYYGRIFNGQNLGSLLLSNGYSFVGYAEDLPSEGYTGADVGDYADRHNPWKSFTNIPSTSNKPFSAFPTDFTQLPHMSWVVPNIINDIHDGTINQGDVWLKNYIDPYYQWAKNNNSLLIITFDEDDESGDNTIPTVFVGANVKKATITTAYNHYSMLRTFLDFFGLPYIGGASSATTITDAWTTTARKAPSQGTFLYTSPITISNSKSLKYFGTDMAGNSSATQTQTYTIGVNQVISDSIVIGGSSSVTTNGSNVFTSNSVMIGSNSSVVTSGNNILVAGSIISASFATVDVTGINILKSSTTISSTSTTTAQANAIFLGRSTIAGQSAVNVNGTSGSIIAASINLGATSSVLAIGSVIPHSPTIIPLAGTMNIQMVVVADEKVTRSLAGISNSVMTLNGSLIKIINLSGNAVTTISANAKEDVRIDLMGTMTSKMNMTGKENRILSLLGSTNLTADSNSEIGFYKALVGNTIIVVAIKGDLGFYDDLQLWKPMNW